MTNLQHPTKADPPESEDGDGEKAGEEEKEKAGASSGA